MMNTAEALYAEMDHGCSRGAFLLPARCVGSNLLYTQGVQGVALVPLLCCRLQWQVAPLVHTTAVRAMQSPPASLKCDQ